MTVTVVPCLGCSAEVEPVQPPAKCLIFGFASALGIAALEPKNFPLYIAALCDEHAALMAMALTSFAQKNKIATVDELMKSLEGLWK